MIDPSIETPLPLTQAQSVRWLPKRRGQRKPHPSTFFRWAQRGLRGVKLETIRVGGTLCTTEQALVRFFARLSNPTVSARTADTAGSDLDRAEATLERARIR
ncbi:MAG: DUF1580 domain-containing protein [Phycisphaerae bacterium]|nr:DUF1580 domain-containing protein [Tepidisphaeraceae bacterium]